MGKTSVIFPDKCPICESNLVKEEEGSIHYCENTNCPAQRHRKLEHFCSKDAMNIEGLGEAVLSQLLEKEMINTIDSIYHIDFEAFAQLEKQGVKSAENLKNSIESSKDRTFDRFIFALGIKHVGQKISKVLAKYFDSIDSLISADIDALKNINEIGEKIAKSVIDFFSDSENIALIEKLKAIGLNTKKSDEEKNMTSLSYRHSSRMTLKDKRFVITGSFESFSRDKLTELIESHGGVVISQVSKKLDYLIVGEKPGSKLEKAQNISTIKILDEKSFLEMIV